MINPGGFFIGVAIASSAGLAAILVVLLLARERLFAGASLWYVDAVVAGAAFFGGPVALALYAMAFGIPVGRSALVANVVAVAVALLSLGLCSFAAVVALREDDIGPLFLYFAGRIVLGLLLVVHIMWVGLAPFASGAAGAARESLLFLACGFVLLVGLTLASGIDASVEN